MNKTGPIIIIEDDQDDQLILSEVLKELNFDNEVIFFADGEEALEYLIASGKNPFLILSDINMPKLDGFQLRDKVQNNEQLRLKCIPYLFFTTAVSQRAVIDAYSKSVQGFFVKPQNYQEIKRVIENIIRYWQDCHSPNKLL
jgi:CheY-like chemotaxis protein